MKKGPKIALIIISIILLTIAIIVGILWSTYSSYTKGSVGVIDRPNDVVVEKVDNSNDIPATVGKDIETNVPEVTEAIPPVETPSPEEIEIGIYEQNKIDEDVVNIVLMGMDARNYEDLSRSDAIILVSYRVSDGNIKMISFMRDSLVYIPNKYWSRINAATALGGPGLLINTINENFDLDVQNYVQIKFDDFKKVIDIIRGVPMELSLKEVQYINKKMHVEDGVYDNDLPNEAGTYTLNGQQALWHCRNRSVGNSDFTRTERQRNTLEAILNKMRHDVSISQIAEVIYTMKDYVNTNLDLEMIVKLGISVLGQDSISIEAERVPFEGAYSPANKNGASVLAVDIEKTTNLIHKFLYDSNTQDSIFGTYVYEHEGFGGPFNIEIKEDGTFSYYEGLLSSYIGKGQWKLNADEITLKDSNNKYVFKIDSDSNSLVFVRDASAEFTFIDVGDGDKFVLQAEADFN